MKKIDLHVHTVSTESDVYFTFDLETLEKYVDVNSLDCIGITNHNVFDSDNFNLIIEKFSKSKNNLVLLPGIEIDVKTKNGKGQVLILTDISNLDEFIYKCSLVAKELEISNYNKNKKKKFITIEKLKEIFFEKNFKEKIICIP
ncbi:MAG: hypothetical protein K2K18_02200, partial [Malacoplasma sp.]|nr:hypothetical protein [Malacoplasma sp.]